MDTRDKNEHVSSTNYSEVTNFIETILNNAKSDPSAIFNEDGELIGFKGFTGDVGPTK